MEKNIKDGVLSSNLEDYLEAISWLSQTQGHAHPSEIAEFMRVKKPSVTSALNTLLKKGYIEYEKYRPVTLTEKGANVADNISSKHRVLKDFFENILGADSKKANMAACEMEHSLDDDLMERLVLFIKNANQCAACAANDVCDKSCPNKQQLCSLKENEKAVVVKTPDKTLKISEGDHIKILNCDFDGRILLKIGNAELAVKKSDAKSILVKKL